MIKKKKFSATNSLDLFRTIRAMLLHHEHGWGMVSLAVSLVILSILAGVQPGGGPSIYLAGEVADHDVVASRDMQIEDAKATQARRDQVLSTQPLVFDLDKESMALFRSDTLGLLHAVNTRGLDDAGLDEVREEFNKRHGSDISAPVFRQLAQPAVQNYLLNAVVPWLEQILNEGVLPDMRQLTTMSNAVIVRDVENGTETLRTQADGLHDQRSLLVALGQMLRGASELKPQAKSALLEIVPLLVLPTLAVNQDVTNLRNAEITRAVDPVLYSVRRGEVVVRAGDRITYEQQLKMQSLFDRQSGPSNAATSLGTLIIGFLLGLGLFMTPSGNKGKILRTKDQHFIAFLLLTCGLSAWGLAWLFHSLPGTAATVLAFAFPVAGGAGLSVLIFSARRYCGVGLLLSFFSVIMFRGDLALFFFYFLSAMVNTWLVLRAQSRQDMVWAGLPLFAWLLVSGAGAALLLHVAPAQYPALVVALACNALLSILLLFAVSPILELLMGFTTRFRLMELMNLEQPLLKELMMTIPGTYHHSLVVSNLVEAGAAAVGANSLLCKVAALYHDIGKLSRPDYFSENQFGGPNPHDKLSPAMSALVLGAHVKQGMELALAHRLGSEINAIIGQHHGTRSVSFFYQKALELGENPRPEDFCYAGPRPQTSEAAIVMLADAVEAASRSLVEPTPARIRAHVESIIKAIHAEGQLDESDLTFRDLNKLIDSFTRILTGLFHQRIAYPDRDKACRADKARNGKKAPCEPNEQGCETCDASGESGAPSAPASAGAAGQSAQEKPADGPADGR